LKRVRSRISFREEEEPEKKVQKVLSRALKVAESIDDAYWKAIALGNLAISSAEAGQFDRALKLAKSIDDDSEKAIALCKIANVIIKKPYKIWSYP